MKVRAKVGQTDLIFASPLIKQRFIDANKDKDVFIVVDDSPSAEMRRYFEGCLVPVTFYAHPNSGWDSFEDAREALKLEFLPSKVRNAIAPVRGQKEFVIARSTTTLSKEKFGQFIEAISRWLIENELCTAWDISPEEYKAWRDSAPEPGAIYPPLQRLKELYAKGKND